MFCKAEERNGQGHPGLQNCGRCHCTEFLSDQENKDELKKTEWSLKREPGYDNAKRNGIENMRVWLHT